MQNDPIDQLTNEYLLREVKALVSQERRVTVQLIAMLGELDVRRLYLAEGYSSLFTYCTQCLHLSEHASYDRIEAARAARKYPRILDLLEDGSITLTTVSLLASHLTPENHDGLLTSAIHKSKREVEQQIAALRPLPPVPSVVRKLPAPTPAAVPGPMPPAVGSVADNAMPRPRNEDGPLFATPVTRSSVIVPLAPERYKVQFTATRETHDKLRRVQDLLRHSVPDGDPTDIFDRALTLLLRHLEQRKLGRTHRPRLASGIKAGSRHVPARVRRDVWARDDGRCAFVGTDGRCRESRFLEFHHVVPFAAGGQTTSDNLQLRCRLCRYRHNRHYADWRIMPRRRTA